MADYKVIDDVPAANIKIISNIAVADIRSVTGGAKQPAAGFEGLYDLDALDKFTSITDMVYQTAGPKFSRGPWTGIMKATNGAGWNSGAISKAQITDETFAYVQWKMDAQPPGSGQWNLIAGMGYVGVENIAGAPRDWATWQWELTAGGSKVYNGTASGYEYSDVYVDWNAARICRIEVNAGVVTYKFSDNGGASWTTWWTTGWTVNIGSNSNLVAMVAPYSDDSYFATPENLKIYGSLVNT